MTSENSAPSAAHALTDFAPDARARRSTSLRALHSLEYALSAPAPRRHRTWVHRVSTALDVLAEALDEQLHKEDQSIGLLSEIALTDTRYALQIQRLRQELLDLTIAAASLREQIEPDPEFGIDAADIRDRLATIARRFRQHRARESDLVYDATGININGDE